MVDQIGDSRNMYHLTIACWQQWKKFLISIKKQHIYFTSMNEAVNIVDEICTSIQNREWFAKAVDMTWKTVK